MNQEELNDYEIRRIKVMDKTLTCPNCTRAYSPRYDSMDIELCNKHFVMMELINQEEREEDCNG